MSIIPDVGTVDVSNSPGFERDGTVTLASGETYLYGMARQRPEIGSGNLFVLEVQTIDMTTLDLGLPVLQLFFERPGDVTIDEMAVTLARFMQNARDGENV